LLFLFYCCCSSVFDFRSTFISISLYSVVSLFLWLQTTLYRCSFFIPSKLNWNNRWLSLNNEVWGRISGCWHKYSSGKDRQIVSLHFQYMFVISMDPQFWCKKQQISSILHLLLIICMIILLIMKHLQS